MRLLTSWDRISYDYNTILHSKFKEKAFGMKWVQGIFLRGLSFILGFPFIKELYRQVKKLALNKNFENEEGYREYRKNKVENSQKSLFNDLLNVQHDETYGHPEGSISFLVKNGSARNFIQDNRDNDSLRCIGYVRPGREVVVAGKTFEEVSIDKESYLSGSKEKFDGFVSKGLLI